MRVFTEIDSEKSESSDSAVVDGVAFGAGATFRPDCEKEKAVKQSKSTTTEVNLNISCVNSTWG